MERMNSIANHLSAEGAASSGSRFSSVPLEPPDAIFGISAAFAADKSPDKVNLVVGAYRTNEGKPWVLPAVRKAEERIANAKVDHEYLPIDGLPEFRESSARLVFGDSSPAIAEKRVVTCQALSGSGSLRLGADFLRKFLPGSTVIYISNPTWANHNNIFSDAGYQVRQYRYFLPVTCGLDLPGFLADLRAAPNGSVIMLHVCAHNPTGVDPTPDEWRHIADVIVEKNHFPFFDSAYQGFATGDLARDAFSVRLFAERNIEFVLAQSFAKNLGLYGERVGAVHIHVTSPQVAVHITSQMKRLVRGSFSNPPSYGARIAATVLTDPILFAEWDQQIKVMAHRIIDMRRALHEALVKRKTPGSWTHVIQQIGMFSFLGLNANQCQVMMDKHHVFLTKNGRISMAGLNTSNVHAVADAIHDVVVNVK